MEKKLEEELQKIERKRGEETMKWVAFVAGVLNAPINESSKTERVSLVVEVVEQHLDMNGVL